MKFRTKFSSVAYNVSQVRAMTREQINFIYNMCLCIMLCCVLCIVAYSLAGFITSSCLNVLNTRRILKETMAPYLLSVQI